MSSGDLIETLCRGCGLCCNGVLFSDVRLASNELVEMLELGLIERGGETGRFSQPCPQLQGCDCGVYQNRPRQCRAFECELLRRTCQGERSEGEALRVIAEVRDLAETLSVQLRELGDGDESGPFSSRFARLTEGDGERSGDWWDRYAETSLLVRELQARLRQEFYSAESGTP